MAGSEQDSHYDVGIIGGGPAGSAMGAYLAQAGLKCAIFEGAEFPREHVGESLVPATTPVLLETGVMPKVEAAGFPKKYGAAWTSAETRDVDHNGFSGLSHDFRAAEVLFGERPQESVDRDYTFHVDRGRFDLILLEHAESCGVEVFQGTRVPEVEFRPGLPAVIKAKKGLKSRDVQVDMVVDASGRRTLLGNQLRLKKPDPVFNQYAIHTWFEGFDRDSLAVSPDQTEYIYVHFLPITDSWVWQIPITDTITSVGVVTQKSRFAASKAEREQFFWDSVASRPELYDALKGSQQVKPFKAEGDYSYSMSKMAGDRFVMIGDAARFVDPIFSSGVSVALNSARLAAHDIIEASRSGRDYPESSFSKFTSTMQRAVSYWYEFISIYYRLNILFTAFVQDPRYRMDILKMLQGDVYDEEEPKVLSAMRQVVNAVEENPNHLWKPYLGDLRVQSPTG